MIVCDFTVIGTPKSTQTGRVVKIGKFLRPLRRGGAWSTLIAKVAQDKAPAYLVNGPISIAWIFYLQAPKKRKYPVPVTRPDTGNLTKGNSDALNGVIWFDDSQIVDEYIFKRYADGVQKPGVRVLVITGYARDPIASVLTLSRELVKPQRTPV